MRRFIAAVTLACITATAWLTASPALAAPPRSPAGRVLAVTQNLRAGSAAEMRGLRAATHVFARRLLDQAPYRPDVIVLQEVVRKSARKVASVMTKVTPDRYVVAKSASRSARRVRLGKRRMRTTNTAIVINAATMKRIGKGGWLRTPYARRHASRGKVRVRRHAHIPVAERGTGMRVALMSLHWVRDGDLRSRRLARIYRQKWAERTAKLMRRRYRGSSFKVVAGDFNQHRCASRASDNCRLSPHYRKLRRGFGYRDPVYARKRTGGVDYILTTGGFSRAGADLGYNKDAAEGHPDRWYSDHRFRWALLHR